MENTAHARLLMHSLVITMTAKVQYSPEQNPAEVIQDCAVLEVPPYSTD